MVRPGPLSFRTRLTLRWTAAFGVIITATLAGVYIAARGYGYRILDRHLRTIAATELAASTDTGAAVHLHEFPLDALDEGEFAPKFSRVYDSSGRVVLNTGEVAADEALLDDAALRAALAGNAPVLDITARGRLARVVALRATADDGATYVFAVGTFTDQLNAGLTRLLWILAGVWALALSATATIGYALASRALEPIERITARAAAIARDQVDARLDPPAVDDEVGRMTHRLNDMLGRLHEVIDAHRHFAADASHELRSPLTAIKGEVDVALTRDRDAEEYRTTLRLVRAQVDEMFKLTENLMLLVRADHNQAAEVLDEVPLAQLLEGTRERLAWSARERDVTIALLASDPDLAVFGDARLLGRALDNIVANAVKHTSRGRKVVIDAAYTVPAEDVWEAGSIRITVTDSGPGIPQAQWERIFDRFVRLDESRSRRTGGTGLGLPICRAILKLYGGSVRVARSGPEGTTFELVLRGHRISESRVAQVGLG